MSISSESDEIKGVLWFEGKPSFSLDLDAYNFDAFIS